MEIRLSEVNPSDQITIRTQFSAYSFRITDPLKCRGFLSGGLLGDEQHDAFFAGGISTACGELRDSERLEAGYRAVFFVAGNDDPKRLTTSIVTEINLSVTSPEIC